MWTFFFILGLIATVLLLVHITVEMNSLDKNISNLLQEINKHYERKPGNKSDKPAHPDAGSVHA